MSKKILITDDTAFMRMTLKKTLESNGYEVIGEAENGVQSVELYKELRPDLVTMDITMPEMNGIDAVKNIMSIDANAKIVMVSAMGQKSMVIEALTSGAKDFIVKPFTPDRIMETMKKLLG